MDTALEPLIAKVCPQCGWDDEKDSRALIFCSRCRFPLLIVGGVYTLERELATGGFGTVYLARHIKTDEQVVIKAIKVELLEADNLIVRFHREIRVTKQLSELNEHIVKIVSHGSEPGLGHFYAMEYLQGQPLVDYLDDDNEQTFENVFHIFGQFCEAMQIAHDNGIVHRDLKPDNIYLIDGKDNPLFVKVLDFGIAKPLEGTLNKGLTSKSIGTPHYMAPEQCINDAVDIRSDIYAMGVLLYEMLTGTLPFMYAGDSPLAIVFSHLNTAPEPIRVRRPDLPLSATLEAVVSRALEKNPAHRFQSSAAMWEALSACRAVHKGVIPPAKRRGSDQKTGKFAYMQTMEPASLQLSLGDAGPLHGVEELQRWQSAHALQSGELEGGTPSGVLLSSAKSGVALVTMDAVEDFRQAASDPNAAPPLHPTVMISSSRRSIPSNEGERTPRWIPMVVVCVVVFVLVGGGFLWREVEQTKSRIAQTSAPALRPSRGNGQVVQKPSNPIQRPIQRPLERPLQWPVTQRPSSPQVRVRSIIAPQSVSIVRKRAPVVRRRRVLYRRTPRQVRVTAPVIRAAPRVAAASLCGAVPEGIRLVEGVMQKPTHARISFLRCPTCQVFQRKGLYCLLLPQKTVRIRLKSAGYRKCTHSLSSGIKRIQWTLETEDPDQIAGTSYYACYKGIK